jgi:GNAT superfamily N-acetyltransferase
MIVGLPNPISLEPNGAEIPRIYFLPGAQRLGLGRQLLAAAIEQAHDESLTHIWLDVMASADWARRGPCIFRVWDQPVDRPPLDLIGRPRPLISGSLARGRAGARERGSVGARYFDERRAIEEGGSFVRAMLFG